MIVIAAGAVLLASDQVVISVAASAVTWIGVPWLVVSFSTMSQRLTPARLQGRVGAAVDVTLGPRRPCPSPSARPCRGSWTTGYSSSR